MARRVFHVKQSRPLPEPTLELIAELIPGDQAAFRSQLRSFHNLIVKVNPRINLVSRHDTGKVLDDLIYDSVALLRFIKPGAGDRLLDLGSGAGFPGLIFAMALSKTTVISVEANRRKIEFQRQVVRELKLANVELVNDRIEKIPSLDVDLAVGKAFASLTTACRLISPHLRSGADLFLPRSRAESRSQSELSDLGLRLVDLHMYQSATSQRRSHLIHIKKL